MLPPAANLSVTTFGHNLQTHRPHVNPRIAWEVWRNVASMVSLCCEVYGIYILRWHCPSISRPIAWEVCRNVAAMMSLCCDEGYGIYSGGTVHP